VDADESRRRITRRLGRYADGDIEAVVDPAAVAEAATLLAGQPPDTGDLVLAGWLRWQRYLVQDPAAGRADLDAAIELFERVLPVQPEQVPTPVRDALESGADAADHVARANGTVYARAEALLLHALAHPGSDSAEAAIELLRPRIDMLAADDPWRTWLLGKLIPALMHKFNQAKSPVVLEELIGALRQTLAALGGGPEHVSYRAQLAVALSWRALAAPRDAGQLDEAIGELRQAISQLRATAPQDQIWLGQLEAGLAECQQAHEDLAVPGSAGEALRLVNQAQMMWAQSEAAGGDQALADESIAMFRRAADLTPDWPNRAAMLNNLSVALLRHGLATHSVELLTECQATLEEVTGHIPADVPLQSMLLANLALACRGIYLQTGDPEMAAEAMRRMREAIAVPLPAGSLGPFVLAADAGDIWSLVAETQRDPRVLEEILPKLRAAAADCQHPPQKVECYRALANVLRLRGVLAGQPPDLAEAVTVLDLALQLSGQANRSALLTNLALTLTDQYNMDSQLDVLRDALMYARQAVTGLPPDAGASARSILAAAAHDMFVRTGDPQDLDEAMEALRAAVRIAAASDPLRARYLANLGAVLMTAYSFRDETGLLAEAVDVFRDAVAATRPADAEYAARLSGFGLALGRSVAIGAPVTLDEAIRVARQAADVAAQDDPYRASALLNVALMERAALHLRYGTASRERAVAAAREAAAIDTAPARHRLEAFRLLGDLLADDEDWAGALDAYRAATDLLPAQSARYLSRADQEHVLARQSGLATEAAACAVRLDDPVEAVKLLEVGRGIMLAQALESRGDLTALRDAHSELAAEFDRVREALSADGAQVSDGGILVSGIEAGARGRTRAEERRRAARDWDRLNARIRAIDGFTRFNLPPAEADIRALAAHGPVVIVNQSRHGTDAMLVTAGGTTAVPLPAATGAAISSARASMAQAQARRLEGTLAARTSSAREMSGVLGWLWDAVAEPVLSALGITGVGGQPGGQLPHVWWLPTGGLALLPLHAAGHHDGRPAVADLVVSSYTPTLNVLRHARRAEQGGPVSAPLVVAMPDTPGQLPLPGAEQEGASLRARYPDAKVLTGATATRQNVLDALPAHRWAHFACHARSDLARPSESCLLLGDYQQAPLTVLDITRLRLDHASLAYLSACGTGEVSATLPDEVIHIASAFQLAGYADVIATMWPVADPVAAFVADDVYRRIGDDRAPVAEALHHAVRRLRDEHAGDPWLWAPFFHTGR
jgi:tetratricopeptide (TPR) repeat protein